MASKKHTKQDATRPTKARGRKDKGHAWASLEELLVRETETENVTPAATS